MKDAKAQAATTAAPYAAYHAALEQRRLTFQRCRACNHAWLPPREECPQCWSAEWSWEAASGRATVVSRVIYHTAFDPRFTDRIPYNVAVVALEEGPRMVTNIVGLPADEDVIGRQVSVVFEADFGRLLPRFKLSGGSAPNHRGEP